jgi:lipoprotein-releasing system permease protein
MCFFMCLQKLCNFVKKKVIVGLISFIGLRFLKVYKGSFSRPVIRIATAGIALSVAVMIVSVVIVKGFQREVRQKVVGFSGHIVIKPFQMSSVDQQSALDFTRNDILEISKKIKGVKNVQPTAEKAGIIKTDDQMEGCVFKGVDENYDKDFFNASIVDGRFPHISQDSAALEVLISRVTANRLHLKVGDDVRMYFLLPGESQPRGRKFSVSGIFDTGLAEFDKKYMIGDINHIQRLNRWSEYESGLVEVIVDDYASIDYVVRRVIQLVDYDLEVWDVRDLYPDIFNWLLLLDMNVHVIIIIMIVVAMINIITILLIRVLEKTTAIGILKSLGASNKRIRRVFLYVSVIVLIKGMLIGNVIGFAIALIQEYTNVITLEQETYYVSSVPIYLDFPFLITLNGVVFLIGLFVMMVPSMIVAKIYPAQTLRLK